MLGSRAVAVKLLCGAMNLDEKQFIKEVQCLMKVRHKNIVRLLGYCADTQGLMINFEGKSVMADVRNRALCFEYVSNGSLDNFITGRIMLHAMFIYRYYLITAYSMVLS